MNLQEVIEQLHIMAERNLENREEQGDENYNADYIALTRAIAYLQ